jgi:hypothetical protein
MFQPQTYLSFGNIGYNLRDNEIIMLQSLLTQEYFENIIPIISNKYVNYNSYDEVKPIISQPYDNVIPSLDIAIGKNTEEKCEKSKNKIKSGIWSKCFPDNFTEIQFSKTNNCTFIFIIDLIEKKIGKKLTINEIKKLLYDEYTKYLEEYGDRIIDILILEGKKTLGNQVKTQSLKFIDFIYTSNYFLTTFDIWLLVQKFEIPSIFISTTKLLQTNKKENVFIGYTNNETNNYAFIVIPGLRSEIIPELKIIESNNNDIFISLDKLLVCEHKNEIENALRNPFSIEEYLKNFTTIKPKKIIIEDSSDDDEKEIKIKKPVIKKKLKIIEDEMSISGSDEIIIKKNATKKLKIKNPKAKSKKSK